LTTKLAVRDAGDGKLLATTVAVLVMAPLEPARDRQRDLERQRRARGQRADTDGVAAMAGRSRRRWPCMSRIP